MTNADVVAFLEHLGELIPDHAPDMTDDLVLRWIGSLRDVRPDEARDVAVEIARRWPTWRGTGYWPSPADFNFVRREVTTRRHIDAARAAVANATNHPRI